MTLQPITFVGPVERDPNNTDASKRGRRLLQLVQVNSRGVTALKLSFVSHAEAAGARAKMIAEPNTHSVLKKKTLAAITEALKAVYEKAGQEDCPTVGGRISYTASEGQADTNL